jgi:hypothetical protein
MKKYIGTKQIEAEAMTLGDFVQKTGRNPYGKSIDNHEETEQGYHVRYEDGYESWSPKDVFERAYKVAETPLDRMCIEYNELMEKYNKLVLFLGRKDAVEIAGEIQVSLMVQQKIEMHNYLLTLRTRIELKKK